MHTLEYNAWLYCNKLFSVERIIKRALDLGISGWMADFSEYLMVDGAVFSSGQSALELHNQWPLRWGKLNREAFEEYNKTGEAVFWMRAGYAGMVQSIFPRVRLASYYPLAYNVKILEHNKKVGV